MYRVYFMLLLLSAPALAGWPCEAAHAAAQASLLVDALQTRQAQKMRRTETGWAANAIGPHPSDADVAAYFGAIMVTELALHLWGPEWLSCSASAATLVVQVPVITRHFSVGVGVGIGISF